MKHRKRFTFREKKADQMFVYKHLTECHVAVQLLLNQCAHYWSFVPMSMEEAAQEEMEISTADSQFCSPYERTNVEVDWCLLNLPQTPMNTRFSH